MSLNAALQREREWVKQPELLWVRARSTSPSGPDSDTSCLARTIGVSGGRALNYGCLSGSMLRACHLTHSRRKERGNPHIKHHPPGYRSTLHGPDDARSTWPHRPQIWQGTRDADGQSVQGTTCHSFSKPGRCQAQAHLASRIQWERRSPPFAVSEEPMGELFKRSTSRLPTLGDSQLAQTGISAQRWSCPFLPSTILLQLGLMAQ